MLSMYIRYKYDYISRSNVVNILENRLIIEPKNSAMLQKQVSNINSAEIKCILVKVALLRTIYTVENQYSEVIPV